MYIVARIAHAQRIRPEFHCRDNFTRAEAEAFIEEAVALAMSSDCSSGGCIRLVTVNADGAHHKFINGSQAPKFQDELGLPTPATGGMILG